MDNSENQDRLIHEALAGAPSWITPDAVRETLRVWSPHYRDPLTPKDAVEILLNVGNLFEVLKDATNARQDDNRPVEH